MTYVLRGNTGSLRKLQSFSVSCALHALVVAWLASLHSYGADDKKSLYDMSIRPEERRIVWYKPAEKLPDIRPTPAPQSTSNSRPERVLRKFDQTIIANATTHSKAEQMIFAPAPEIKMPEPLPLPNVVAITPPPRPVRAFTPPPETRKPQAPATPLPDAPQVKQPAQTASLKLAPVKPERRAFQPPPDVKKSQTAMAVLPDAPQVKPTVNDPKLTIDTGPVRPAPRSFTAPPDPKKPQQATAALPDAPQVARAPIQAANVALAPVKQQPREFHSPTDRSAGNTPPDQPRLPDAPDVRASAETASLPLGEVRAPLKSFKAPDSPLARQSAADPAPLPAAPETNAAPNLAIAGLHPVLKPDFAPPPGSRPANFSAGPDPNPAGSTSISGGSGTLVVPGLLVRGAEKKPDSQRPLIALNSSPTAPENLAAAMRSSPKTPPNAGGSEPQSTSARRVTNAPDERLEGRAIYTMAIQMPNVTSHSGSWLVWFAEHEARAGALASEMKPPRPIRKVDPKYSPAAVDARIEGEVRLFAVIRKDGRVSSVAVVRGVDDRLDRSAAEALAKWEFEPAEYAGRPIDIDAVFEIPFHVAPPPKRR